MARRLAIVGIVLAALLAFLGVAGYALARQNGVAGGSLAAGSSGPARIFGSGQLVEIKPYVAPGFSLGLFSGATWQLDAHRGKPVLVNFWASWCPPCKQEMPVLEQGWTRSGDAIQFVGIDVWDTDADARAFLTQYGASYPVGADPAGRIAINYGLTGVPETFFVDPSGRVVQHYIGPLDAASLNALVATLPR